MKTYISAELSHDLLTKGADVADSFSEEINCSEIEVRLADIPFPAELTFKVRSASGEVDKAQVHSLLRQLGGTAAQDKIVIKDTESPFGIYRGEIPALGALVGVESTERLPLVHGRVGSTASARRLGQFIDELGLPVTGARAHVFSLPGLVVFDAINTVVTNGDEYWRLRTTLDASTITLHNDFTKVGGGNTYSIRLSDQQIVTLNVQDLRADVRARAGKTGS